MTKNRIQMIPVIGGLAFTLIALYLANALRRISADGMGILFHRNWLQLLGFIIIYAFMAFTLFTQNSKRLMTIALAAICIPDLYQIAIDFYLGGISSFLFRSSISLLSSVLLLGFWFCKMQSNTNGTEFRPKFLWFLPGALRLIMLLYHISDYSMTDMIYSISFIVAYTALGFWLLKQ